MVTCVKPAEYYAIEDALDQSLTYDTLQPFLQKNAVSQFTGEEGEGRSSLCGIYL